MGRTGRLVDKILKLKGLLGNLLEEESLITKFEAECYDARRVMHVFNFEVFEKVTNFIASMGSFGAGFLHVLRFRPTLRHS